MSLEQTTLKIDALIIKKASLLIRSINHKLRQSILKLLEENEKMSVTEIYVKLRIEQSVASQHLAILRSSDFLNTIRDGKHIYYSVNKVKLDYVQSILKTLLNEK